MAQLFYQKSSYNNSWDVSFNSKGNYFNFDLWFVWLSEYIIMFAFEQKPASSLYLKTECRGEPYVRPLKKKHYQTYA
jgi:hypothetical protein